ncbi:hypothetical protein Dda_1677 [Drechslerella dactyloides]|uniref:Rhodopsin domain-containing protein n=1 Tax=Drechslerella dactyloides TaxID=74499 RepID=A0AAD6J2C1_DREDA|nr:hypothetical protein Dda_1677 [Drechslerella dactyloides]
MSVAAFCHDVNKMPWNGTDWSWVNTGRTSKMLFACTPYDPTEPAPVWYRRVGLVVICATNSLSIIAITLRTYFRWRKTKRFGKDDWWLIAAGSMSGWAFYFIIASMIKVATCMYYLRFIPDHRTRLQHFVYVLSTSAIIIGLVQAGVWVFNCSPVESNFIYNVEHMACPPVDKARWSWIVFSILVDSALLWIPWRILQQSGLPTAERRVLKLVFAANLLGTLTCIGNVYGVVTFEGNPYYDSYGALDDDFTHSEAAFILINNAEVLMYVIGACFPVLSPYLVSLARSARSGSRNKSSTLPSWRVDIEAADASSPQPFETRRDSQPKRCVRDGDELDTVLDSVDGSRAVTVMPMRVGTGSFDLNGKRSAIADETMGALTPATMVVSLDSAVGFHTVKTDQNSGLQVDGGIDVEMQLQMPAEAHTHTLSRIRSDDGIRYGLGRRKSESDLERRS